MVKPHQRILMCLPGAFLIATTSWAQFDSTAGQLPVSPVAQVTDSVATLTVEETPEFRTIKEKAKQAPAGESDTTEKQLIEIVKRVDDHAAAKGDRTVARRLAADFKVTSASLLDERTRFATGWGDLMIARTILANAKGRVVMQQLYLLRADRLGWGQIANGLDLSVPGLVPAVQSQSRVAMGLAKADGRAARIARVRTGAASAGSAR